MAATGTLPRAMRERAGLQAEAVEDIGETGKVRSPRPAKAASPVKASSVNSSPVNSSPRRRRRRTRAGRELGSGPEETRRKAS